MKTSLRYGINGLAMLLGAAGFSTLAPAAIVINGDFETGDFTGWTVTQAGGSVHGIYTGTGGAGTPMPSAGDGFFAFAGDQTGPSHSIFTQAVTLPTSFTGITLSFDLALNNTGMDFIIPDPDTFDFNLGSNQQFRMEVLVPTASATTVADADILATVYRTQPGDSLTLDWTTISSDLTAELLPHAGESVILRFGAVDNSGPLGQAIDNVSLVAVPEPSQAAILLGMVFLVYAVHRRRRAR